MQNPVVKRLQSEIYRMFPHSARFTLYIFALFKNLVLLLCGVTIYKNKNQKNKENEKLNDKSIVY